MTRLILLLLLLSLSLPGCAAQSHLTNTAIRSYQEDPEFLSNKARAEYQSQRPVPMTDQERDDALRQEAQVTREQYQREADAAQRRFDAEERGKDRLAFIKATAGTAMLQNMAGIMSRPLQIQPGTTSSHYQALTPLAFPLSLNCSSIQFGTFTNTNCQ